MLIPLLTREFAEVGRDEATFEIPQLANGYEVDHIPKSLRAELRRQSVTLYKKLESSNYQAVRSTLFPLTVPEGGGIVDGGNQFQALPNDGISVLTWFRLHHERSGYTERAKLRDFLHAIHGGFTKCRNPAVFIKDRVLKHIEKAKYLRIKVDYDATIKRICLVLKKRDMSVFLNVCNRWEHNKDQSTGEDALEALASFLSEVINVCKEHDDSAPSLKVLSDRDSNAASNQFDAYAVTMDASEGGDTGSDASESESDSEQERKRERETRKKKKKKKGADALAAGDEAVTCGCLKETDGRKARCKSTVPAHSAANYNKCVKACNGDKEKEKKVRTPLCQGCFAVLCANGSIEMIDGSQRTIRPRRGGNQRSANAAETSTADDDQQSKIQAAVAAAVVEAMDALLTPDADAGASAPAATPPAARPEGLLGRIASRMQANGGL
eukprot:SAG22_NODE_251_length_13703_cov_6.296582_6_plen_440_part_00